jgi:hypothetical protein
MGAMEMVAGLVPTATVKELSSGTNKVFRLLEESGESTVVKVYATPARERRERHALEALLGVPGVPRSWNAAPPTAWPGFAPQTVGVGVWRRCR